MKCPLFRGAFLTILAISIIASGCATRPPQSHDHSKGRQGGSLSYRLTAPPQTLNYLMASDESSLTVAFYLMGGRLAEFDHANCGYQPGIAESWRMDGDGRMMNLTLRDGLRFSDGHPLTAEDIEFTLRAMYDARTASPAFREAMLINGKQIGIEIMDPRHLRLKFPEITAAPESYLSNLAVLPRHILEPDLQQGKLRDAYRLGSDPGRIVTAGAFVPAAVQPGERITLRRNPYYWKKDLSGTRLPYLDQIVIEIVSDANNASARLNQGGLDVIDRLRPTDYAALRSKTGSVRAIDAGAGLSTDYFWFNLSPLSDKVRRAWFGDLRFRRAISHAIDRDSIASITLQGLASPLHSFVSPGNRAWIAQELPRIAYDPEKSRALLREAGFQIRGEKNSVELFDVDGHRVEFTLLVPAESQPRITMAAAIQNAMAGLGIRMQVAPLEFGELSRRMSQSLDYDAILLGASVTEPDPSSYANFLRTSSPLHQWSPKQAKPATDWEAAIDSSIEAMARETDPARRRQIFASVQAMLAEQSPIIPITARHLTVGVNARIGNHRPSALLPYSLWNAEELFISP